MWHLTGGRIINLLLLMMMIMMMCDADAESVDNTGVYHTGGFCVLSVMALLKYAADFLRSSVQSQ